MAMNTTIESESVFINQTDKDLAWESNVSATMNGTSAPMPSYRLVYYSVLFVWSILGITGNSLTVLVIWKYEHLRTSTNFIIASLATTDFLSSLLNPSLSFLIEWLTLGLTFSSVWLIIVMIRSFIYKF